MQKRIEDFSEDASILVKFMLIANSEFVKGVTTLNEIMYDYDGCMLIDLENNIAMLTDLQSAMKADSEREASKNKPQHPH